MKKMILLVGLLALAATGAEETKVVQKRSEARCKEVMSSNDYAGVWRQQWVSVALRKDGTGLLESPGWKIPMKWSSNGAGRLDVLLHIEGELVSTNRLEYDCRNDTLIMPFEKAPMGSAFTGRLVFTGEALPEREKEKASVVMSKAECERAIRNGDKELHRMDSLDDLPDPRDLIATSNGWFMVDDDYPRLELRPDAMFPQVIGMDMYTGRYDSPMGAAMIADSGVYAESGDDAPEVQVGWTYARTKGLEKKLNEKRIRCSVSARGYQQPFRYSREDYIGTVVLRSLDSFVAILKDELKDMKFPRYYRRYRVKTLDELDEEAGRPRRKRQSIDDIVEY